MNLCHSTNTPCQCVDRHSTRSLSTDCKPFNIKTSPATPDFTQKQTLNLYKINSQHSFNSHPSYSRLNTQNLRSNPTCDTKSKPKHSHTQNFSNTPKPTMTPLIQIPCRTSRPTLYSQAHPFLPTRSYFHPSYSRLNTQNLRSNPTRDIKPKPKYSHTQNHLTPQNQP